MRRRRVDFSEKGMADFQKNLYRAPTDATPNIFGQAHQKWAFVFGLTPKGKKVCDGPFKMTTLSPEYSEEANEAADQFIQARIFYLLTRDMSRAKSEIKHVLLSEAEEHIGADTAIERMKDGRKLRRKY